MPWRANWGISGVNRILSRLGARERHAFEVDDKKRYIDFAEDSFLHDEYTLESRGFLCSLIKKQDPTSV